MRSLQFRLAWRLALVFAAVILATSLALLFHRGVGREIPSEALAHAVGRLAGALSRGPDGKPAMSLDDDDINFDYAILSPDGNRLFASANPPEATGVGNWPEGYLRHVGPSGERIAAFDRVDTAVGSVEILVEMNEGAEGSVDRLAREVAGELLPILLPTLLGALLIGAWTLRDGLKPLKLLAREAARITPADSDRRLPMAGLPSELAPLVGAINAALDRLAEGFRAQRDFTADAAHQLRTPLAILGAHLDTLGDQATAGALREDVARMARLVEQLLQVAELEALTLGPEERADLSAVAVEVAQALAPLAIRRRREVAVLGGEAVVNVHGNRDSLHQALRNLVENAINHTAEGTAVEISIRQQPPAVVVSDHGPGIPPADRAQLFRRFWRGDRSGGRGAGLGLAIVQRIAAAHGARISVEEAPGGGARFVLAFPALQEHLERGLVRSGLP
jgi:signal transduction histidine kinase